ncbi:maker775, partial [Drosophila busckii]
MAKKRRNSSKAELIALRKMKPTAEQEAAFVAFMTSHVHIAKCNVNKKIFKDAWIELSAQLNWQGPPCKPFYKWQQVWKDWKQRIIEKVARNRRVTYSKQKRLTGTEKDLAVLLQLIDATDSQFIEAEREVNSYNLRLRLQKSAPDTQKPLKFNALYKRNIGQRTADQEAIFVAFMTTELEIARSNVHGKEFEGLWVMLSEELNCYGPPRRPFNHWQLVWQDWKQELAAKVAANKGLARSQQEQLTRVEEDLALVLELIDASQCRNIYGEWPDEVE